MLRHGGDLVFTADTAKECTVVITGTNGTTYPPFTVTADEAKATRLRRRTPDSKPKKPRHPRVRHLGTGYQALPTPSSRRRPHLNVERRIRPVAVRSAAAPEPPTAAPRQVAAGGTTQHKLRAAIDRLTPGQRHDVAERWRTEQLPAIEELNLDQFMAGLDIILDVLADDRPPDDAYEEPDPDREEDADNYRYAAPDDDSRPF